MSQGKQKEKYRGVFVGFIILTTLSPLAFGSIHVWAYTTVICGVYAFFFLFVLKHLLFSDSIFVEWKKTPIDPLIIGMLFFIFLQLVPLPDALVSSLSHQTFLDKFQLGEIIDSAISQEKRSMSWISISYYHHPLIVEGLKWVAYSAMFFLSIHVISSKKRLVRMVYLLIFLGSFETFYALYQTFSETPKVWWWTSRIGQNRWASGTFIGANHFAFYIEMILPISFGFMISLGRGIKRQTIPVRTFRSRINRMVEWFSPESYSLKRMVFLFVSIFLGVGLLLSASRGGILSMGVSILFMSLLFFGKKRYRRYGLVCLLFCVIVVGYGTFIGMDQTFQKFERTRSVSVRLESTKSALAMMNDYPLMGVGIGNFRFLYPRYITNVDTVSGSGYAHNDWAELGAETGWIGFLFVFFFYLYFLFRMIRVWIKRRDRFAVGIGSGVILALISTGIHSLVDFSMKVPANPMTLSVIAGIGYLAVHTREHGGHVSFFYRTRKKSLPKALKILIASGLFIFLFLLTLLSLKHFLAETHCPTEWNSTLNLNWNPYLTDIQKAISYNPLNAEYHFKEGKYYQSVALSGNPDLKKEYNEKAVTSFQNAVRLNPVNALYWRSLGFSFYQKDYDSGAFRKKWIQLADKCYALAEKFAPDDPGNLFQVSMHRLTRLNERKNSGHPLFVKKTLFRKCVTGFQKTIRLQPKKWKTFFQVIWNKHPDPGFFTYLVPETDPKIRDKMLNWIKEKQVKKN